MPHESQGIDAPSFRHYSLLVMRREAGKLNVPSGSIVALVFAGIIGVGGVIAMKPKLEPHGRERKQLAKDLGKRLREHYPDAHVFVRADPCPQQHRADVEIHLNQRVGTSGLDAQHAELQTWFHREFPDCALTREIVMVAGKSKEYNQSHDR